MRYRSGAVVVALLASAACADAEPDAAVEMEPAAPPATGVPADPAPTTAPPVNLSFQPVENSGVQGSATLMHDPDSVRVRFDLQGMSAGTSYTVHLHRGRCGEDRGRAASLPAFQYTAGSGGMAGAFARDALSPSERDYFMEIHGPDETVVTCADLPEHSHTQGASM